MGEIQNGSYISQYSGDKIDELLETTVWQSNDNLLDNWDFSNADNIVDQRGGYIVPSGVTYYSDAALTTSAGTTSAYTKATYVNTTYGTITVSNTTYYVAYADMMRGYTGTGYGLDRWRMNRNQSSVIINQSNIHIHTDSSSGYAAGMEQLIPTERVPDGTYTISVLSSTSFLTTTGSIKASATGYQLSIGDMSAWIAVSRSNNLWKFTLTAYDVDIIAIKFEKGTIQTLAHQENGVWVLNRTQDYGEELAKCQRYYEILSLEEYLQANIPKQYVMRTLVEMRTNLTSSNCTLKSLSGTVGKLSAYTGSAWVDADASVQQMDTPNARKSAVRVSRTATSNQYCAGYLIADCDL